MPTDPNQFDAMNAIDHAAPTTDGASTPGSPQAAGRDRTGLVQRVMDWLRAGYPQGVPREDYVALLGVLHRQLTDTEIRQVVDQLVADREIGEPVGVDEVRDAVQAHVLQPARAEDITRVHARLAAAGWPLADVSGA